MAKESKSQPNDTPQWRSKPHECGAWREKTSERKPGGNHILELRGHSAEYNKEAKK
jgi:hypothetical protein